MALFVDPEDAVRAFSEDLRPADEHRQAERQHVDTQVVVQVVIEPDHALRITVLAGADADQARESHAAVRGTSNTQMLVLIASAISLAVGVVSRGR